MTDSTDDQTPAPVRAIKGFNPDLTCRGFRFVEGQTYEHPGQVSLCNSGFHAVTLPLDVLRYYPAPRSVWHDVELEGVVSGGSGGDSKVASRKITIGASVNLAGLVKAHVEAIWDQVKRPSKKNAATTGDYANAATTGYSAHVRASVSDQGAIAAVLGQGAAKGALGCWLVLTERDDDRNILGVQAMPVDGKQVKVDTFYALRGGKVVEA